ncbi:diguanylate cyclase domain-containing protein [Anaerobacillus isosaccharinicus]|uniref:Diguanylate cyclase n=1 Tax=Anaerobacillus isosaccharinicus TaxID=1532552 RepID=A0A1S2LI40_9BACI|nr:GGDEF domain-containing protein [Anaerobacillus isosaccharinicus]MBA5588368.1 diguanylate cyclase [Anaerobacillus isosaccharinicus]QOY38199.1 diguanylate cyclase [Anaerobacillus isosaccharinicus]
MKKINICLITALTFAILYFFWLSFSTENVATVSTSIITTAAPLISLLFMLNIYNDLNNTRRNFVLLFILGTFSYFIAELIWNYQVLFLSLGDLPFPGISDLFYFLNTILFISAFIYLVSTKSQRLQLFSFLLDLLIIYSAIIVLLAMKFFVPIFEANGYTTLSIFVSTLYPALVLFLLISMVICFLYKNDTFARVTMFLFIAAISLQVIGDMLFTYAMYHSMFKLNSFLEPLWSLSIILFGIAVYSLSEHKEVNPNKPLLHIYQSFKWNVYRMIIQSGCILTLLYLLIQKNNLIYSSVLTVLIILVLLRQILSSYQIHKLLSSISALKDDLEQKVIERTEELSRKNEDLSTAVEKINYMALHDDLTDLPNRRALHEKLQGLIGENIPFTLLFIDVNKFKEINDSLGHNYGDEVLKGISQVLQHSIKDVGVVFRQSGDEFIITIENINSLFIENIINKIIQNSIVPLQVVEQRINVSFSIGVSQYPKDGNNLNEIIRCADFAMYKAKNDCIDCCYPNTK